MQVEKDEEYIKSVTALGAVIEDLVKANNAVDIYEEYFAGKVIVTAVPLLFCTNYTLLSLASVAHLCRHLNSAVCSKSSQCRLCMTLHVQHGEP